MAAPSPLGATVDPSPWPALQSPPPLPAPVVRAPRPPGSRRGLAIGLVAGLVVLAGGGAFGVHTYAKRSVCAAFSADGSLSGGSGGDATAGDIDLHVAADQMRGTARLLIFDGDLRTAINGLAGDADRMADLQTAATSGAADAQTIGKVLLIAGSLNSHARQAQEACGLPAVGVFES